MTKVSCAAAAENGQCIKAFYDANGQVIIAQLILGVLLLVPFLKFARCLDKCALEQGKRAGGWQFRVALVFAGTELLTNVPA
jgi:hypothetical protein